MEETPLVSILMTSFNREKYIAEAIESVLASTYTNFELIIVDDCSKDSTVQIAKKYEAVDKRVTVYINEKNLGDYPNRNEAALKAKGKYLKYIDADDAIYPWGLEVIVKYMEQFPSAGYGLDSIEQDPSKPFPILLTPEEAYERNYFFMPVFHKAPTSCILRTNIFKKHNGFSGKWMVGDLELWHKLSKTENVLLMPHGIIWSRIHDEQESKQTRNSSVVLFRYSVVEVESLNQKGCPLNIQKRNLIRKRIIRSQSRSILRSLLIEKNLKAVREKMKLSKLSFLSCLINAFRKYE